MKNYRNKRIRQVDELEPMPTIVALRRTNLASSLLRFRLLLLRLLHLDQLILLESLRYSCVHLQALVKADVRAAVLFFGDRAGGEVEHTVIEAGLRQTIVDREQLLDLLNFVRDVSTHSNVRLAGSVFGLIRLAFWLGVFETLFA